MQCKSVCVCVLYCFCTRWRNFNLHNNEWWTLTSSLTSRQRAKLDEVMNLHVDLTRYWYVHVLLRLLVKSEPVEIISFMLTLACKIPCVHERRWSMCFQVWSCSPEMERIQKVMSLASFQVTLNHTLAQFVIRGTWESGDIRLLILAQRWKNYFDAEPHAAGT